MPFQLILRRVALLFLFLPVLSLAQNTAEVRGKITTPDGKPVVSAFVVLAGSDMGQFRAATTDDAGAFILPGISIGSYSMSVKADGFDELNVPSVRVSIGRVTDLKIVLGTDSSKSRYNAAISQLETSNTQLGMVTGSSLLSTLPLKSRDTFDLLQLQPGVEGTVGASLFYGNDRPGVVSVNGGRARSNSYNVNGGHAGDLMVNHPAVQPSPESIDEFRVITHGFDAELGRNSASVLNVVTKSGTKEFHGSLYEYFRNKVLNSRGYFDVERPDFNQNDFGGTLGGPIGRGNTFFFGSYERRKLRRGITSEDVAVPTPLERAGDFSSGPAFTGVLQDQTVADVLNARPGCASAIAAAGGAALTPGTAYADIFPGNVIPSACIDATAAALLSQYVPNGNIGDSSYRSSPLGRVRSDQVSLRLDHTFTSQQQLSFYYYGSDGYDLQPFTDLQGLGANLPGFGTTTRERFQQFNLSHIWNINAKTTNELRFVYSRQGQHQLLSPQNTSLLSESCGSLAPEYCFSDPANPRLGITPGLGAQREGLPYIQLAGSFGIGNNQNGWFSQTGGTYQVSETYSRVLGKHNVKFGSDLRNQRLNQLYLYDINGSLWFTGGGPNDVGYESVLPNYLLGLADNFAQGSANSVDSRTTNLGLFAQDSWRVRPNVNLNYGLRWEWSTPWADAGGRVQAFRPGQATSAFKCTLDPANPLAAEYGSSDCSPSGAASAVYPLGLVFPSDKGVGKSLTSAQKNTFAPRVGIAWSPNASTGWLAALTGGPGKTSIRAGWGMAYDTTEQMVISQFAAEPPYGGNTTLSNVFLNTPFLGQDGTVNPNPFSGYLDPARGSSVDFSQFRPILLFGNVPDKMERAYSEQYHLTIQRTLPGELLLQLGYVGSQGHNLLATQDMNVGNPQTCLDLNQIPGLSCGPYGADASYYIPANAIPNGVTLHLPYGPVASVTGPNPNPITLVGLRRYSSPLCDPTTGSGCPIDGVPVFGSIFTTTPIATSSYNSLQALLSKPLSRGLQFNLAYTYSKSIDSASSFEQSVNPYDVRRSRSLSLFDARHRFVLSGYWQLPGVPVSGWARHVLNGWATSGILTVQSGFPIRITSSSDRELMNSYDFEPVGQPTQVAPLRILDPRTSGGYYFDPASFEEAELGTIGNAPRAICCGPGVANLDLAVHKTLQVGERTRAQFRAEFFNVFNHTQFLAPEGDIAAGDIFGQVQRARDPRIIQFAIRLEF